MASSRLTLAHGLMVVAGLVTFLLVSAVLRDRRAMIEVWVANENVAAGTLVTAAQLVSVEIEANDPLVTSFVPVGALPEGLRLVDDVMPGEPLLRSDLATDGAVASGRTFTIPIDSLILDGLGLRVGDRLDVIGLDEDDLPHYVVADVAVSRLPAADQRSAFAAASSRTGWVTIEVDENQALALSLAQLNGDVQLVRSTGASPVSRTSSSAEPSGDASGSLVVGEGSVGEGS